MTISRIIAHTLPLALFFVAGAVFAQEGTNPQDYLLVGDLPFVKDVTTLSGYLSAIFKLGIGIAVTLAIFMIVFGGIKYMISDVPGVKVDAKSDIKNALLGLLLVLSSWLILNTINPDLVKFNFIKRIEDAANAVTPPPAGPTSAGDTGACKLDDGRCIALPTSLPNSAWCGQSCLLDKDLVAKLLQFHRNSYTSGWTITEAYPPRAKHQNPCHYDGTCIDANFRPPLTPTPTHVSAFIAEAKKAGMSACYEIKNDRDPWEAGSTISKAEKKYNDLIAGGVPASNVKILDGVTADHFSVYGNTTNCFR